MCLCVDGKSSNRSNSFCRNKSHWVKNCEYFISSNKTKLIFCSVKFRLWCWIPLIGLQLSIHSQTQSHTKKQTHLQHFQFMANTTRFSLLWLIIIFMIWLNAAAESVCVFVSIYFVPAHLMPNEFPALPSLANFNYEFISEFTINFLLDAFSRSSRSELNPAFCLWEKWIQQKLQPQHKTPQRSEQVTCWWLWIFGGSGVTFRSRAFSTISNYNGLWWCWVSLQRMRISNDLKMLLWIESKWG